MCLTLTFTTSGSAWSAPHVTKGSRSLLNALLSSHNKSNLWPLTPNTEVRLRPHSNQRYTASTSTPTCSWLDTTPNITHTLPLNSLITPHYYTNQTKNTGWLAICTSHPTYMNAFTWVPRQLISMGSVQSLELWSAVLFNSTEGNISFCLHSGKLEKWWYSSWCREQLAGRGRQYTSVLGVSIEDKSKKQ